MQTRRIGYFGSPEISAELLKAIHSGGHEIAFVVSNPDRRRGRSATLLPSAVSSYALECGLPLHRPESLKEAAPLFAPHAADLYLVFAYGKLIPRSIFAAPPFQTLNLHASLLPRWRGAAPVPAAVLAGDERTGWTVQQISERLDEGPIIAASDLEIGPEENAPELLQRMLPSGITLVLAVLQKLEEMLGQARPQSESDATYCQKIQTEDARINWQNSALKIQRQVRAYAGWPVAHTRFRGRQLKIHRARLAQPLTELTPGTIQVDSGRILVATGEGWLEILELQPENRNRLTAREFANGFRLEKIEAFGE